MLDLGALCWEGRAPAPEAQLCRMTYCTSVTGDVADHACR